MPDIYQKITDHIIASIEAGAGEWKMPWHTSSAGGNMVRPINAETAKPYRGVNVLALWTAAEEAGYKSNEWATYKQYQEKGAQVRKGEKGTLIVFWKFFDKQSGETGESEDSGGKEADGEKEDRNRSVMARGYIVFNADQVDGYTPRPTPTAAPSQEAERIEHAEAFFAALNADIRHGGNRAFYRPATDQIQMPPFAAFRDPIAYYSTLGHEVAHWTSAKHRLDRNLSGRFGSEAYAAEELIAELSSAFLSADLKLTNEPRPDHAAYVANWLKVLKGDNRAIFTAAAKAQQAIDYLHGLQEPPEPEADTALMQVPVQLTP
jgi:antirestriction protein ArdC